MSDYREELKNKETLRLREIQRELPSFVQAFFAASHRPPLLKPVWRMPTICGFSSAIFMRSIAPSAASSRRI